MSSLVYFNIRLIVAGMLLILGATLFWGVIPSKLRGSIFDNSRKCIGAAIMVMPLSTIVVCLFSLRSLGHNLHIASYLTACYTISILVTVGFVPLLGGKLNFNHPHFVKRFVRGLLGVPIFAMPMVFANIFGSVQSAEVIKCVTVGLLLTAISYQSYTIRRLYREAVQRGNNYYSDDVEVDINWIIKSVFLIFTLELVCVVSTFFPGMGYGAELLLTIYRVATIAYVFSRFMNFMSNFEIMMNVCDTPSIDDLSGEEETSYYKQLSEDHKAQIERRLYTWIRNRGYAKSGVTIDDVATEVATNRTYLSIYINATFCCSFKSWITSYRVELAKELLSGNDTTINISRRVGFSSPLVYALL